MLTSEGVLKARLRADSAYVFGEGLRMEFRGVRVVFVDTAGDSISTATARRGVYHVRKSRLEISDSVSIVTKSGRRLQTARASYDPATNVIRGDSSYVLSDGTPGKPVTGGFEFHPALTPVAKPRPKK